MLNATQKKLSLSSGIIQSLAAGLGLGLVFMAYLVLVGIPKTEARNLYNHALVAIDSGDLTQAKDLLERAANKWSEPYLDSMLEEVNLALEDKGIR